MIHCQQGAIIICVNDREESLRLPQLGLELFNIIRLEVSCQRIAHVELVTYVGIAAGEGGVTMAPILSDLHMHLLQFDFTPLVG
jgi:hypothetical protein